MDNLTAQDPNLQSNSQDGTDQQPVQPGLVPATSPHLMPSGSEGPFSLAKAVETLIPQEDLKKTEVEKPIVQEPLMEKVVRKRTETPSQKVEEAAGKVVDKRAYKEPLHELKTTQELTEKADKEEEEFIGHVEEVHTIKP